MKRNVIALVMGLLLLNFSMAQEINEICAEFPEECYVIEENILSVCGDGICDSSAGETRETCPDDCRPENISKIEKGIEKQISEKYDSEKSGKTLIPMLSWKIVAFGITIVVVLILIILKFLKRKTKTENYPFYSLKL